VSLPGPPTSVSLPFVRTCYFTQTRLTIDISTYVDAFVARPVCAAFAPDVEISGFAKAGEGSIGDAGVRVLVVGSTAHV
jgi:hypothetical protein